MEKRKKGRRSTKRECLKCGREFNSKGCWNRLCPNCNVTNQKICDYAELHVMAQI